MPKQERAQRLGHLEVLAGVFDLRICALCDRIEDMESVNGVGIEG
jgi:hypothetical protein